jgi:phosphohistidine phosphatase
MGSKSLFLLRHAKAVAGGTFISDKDRPLSEKGIKDIGKLASKLSKKGLDFELIITSPAVRTITTAQILTKGLKISHSHLVVNDAIYDAEAMNLLKVIASVSKKIDQLMIVGHNPSLMSLASYIAGEPISLSTCSLINFSFDFKEWHDILIKRASKFSFLN